MNLCFQVSWGVLVLKKINNALGFFISKWHIKFRVLFKSNPSLLDSSTVVVLFNQYLEEDNDLYAFPIGVSPKVKIMSWS